PRRSNSPSCRTRSNLACNSSGMSPTSSRNSVPLCASSNRPTRCEIAPARATQRRAFVRELDRPDALRDRASERAPFVTEELAFEQAGRNRRAVHLDQRALAAITEIVDRMGDQFFTGAGFALNQDRRIGRGDDFDLLERAGERRTLADDLREIELALNLFFQVDLFAGQFVLQRFDLVEGQRVFNRDGDLTGDLAEQFGVLPAERVVPQTAHDHYS